MRLNRIALFLCLAVTITGCIAPAPELRFVPNYLSKKETPDYPPYTGPVEVLYQYPEAEFIELGTIRAQGQVWDSRESLLPSVLGVAAEMGANAVVVSPKVHDGFFTILFNRQRMANVEAIAIRYGDLKVPHWPKDKLIPEVYTPPPQKIDSY